MCALPPKTINHTNNHNHEHMRGSSTSSDPFDFNISPKIGSSFSSSRTNSQNSVHHEHQEKCDWCGTDLLPVEIKEYGASVMICRSCYGPCGEPQPCTTLSNQPNLAQSIQNIIASYVGIEEASEPMVSKISHSTSTSCILTSSSASKSASYPIQHNLGFQKDLLLPQDSSSDPMKVLFPSSGVASRNAGTSDSTMITQGKAPSLQAILTSQNSRPIQYSAAAFQGNLSISHPTLNMQNNVQGRRVPERYPAKYTPSSSLHNQLNGKDLWPQVASLLFVANGHLEREMVKAKLMTTEAFQTAIHTLQAKQQNVLHYVEEVIQKRLSMVAFLQRNVEQAIRGVPMVIEGEEELMKMVQSACLTPTLNMDGILHLLPSMTQILDGPLITQYPSPDSSDILATPRENHIARVETRILCCLRNTLNQPANKKDDSTLKATLRFTDYNEVKSLRDDNTFNLTVKETSEVGVYQIAFYPSMSGAAVLCVTLDDIPLQNGPMQLNFIPQDTGPRVNRVSEPHFAKPWGICSTLDGYLVVSDRGNHRIVIMKEDLTPLRTVGAPGRGPGQLWKPAGVCVHPTTKEIFVSDKDNHRVQVFSWEGHTLRMWGNKGKGRGQFNYPWDIAFNPQFNWVAVSDSKNNRVQIFTLQGIHTRTVGASHVLTEPRGVMFNDKGELIVCDVQRNEVLLFRLTTSRWYCRTLSTCGLALGEVNRPQATAMDTKSGRIYLTEGYLSRIQVFDSTWGNALGMFGWKGESAGELKRPSGLCITVNGRLAIVDDENNRVVLYDLGPHSDWSVVCGGR